MDEMIDTLVCFMCNEEFTTSNSVETSPYETYHSILAAGWT